MKKNRPGTLLTVLAKPEDVNPLTRLIFSETTTFGLRVQPARRQVLPREHVSVTTEYGEVRVKVSRVNGRISHAAPEFEDCKRLAAEKDVPLQKVIGEALRKYQEKR
jgi:uncharacterized protein (DUF111 family)